MKTSTVCFLLTSRFLAFISLVVLPLSVHAEMLTFFDETFPNANWTTTKIIDTTPPDDATGASHQILSGGNPGEYRETVHDWTTSVAGVQIEFAHINSSSTYSPSVSGAIVEVNAAFDIIAFSAPHVNAIGFGLAIEQDGAFYTSGYVDSLPGSGWEGYLGGNLTASDFVMIGGTGTPDFSATGSDIRFGYFTFNGGSVKVLDLTAVGGVDNYEVNLTTVPEPATWALILTGVPVFAMMRRKWRMAK